MSTALSIAGIDTSGGAGVFADIKTFSAFGVYGMGVVTAITAQNTCGVLGVKNIERKFFIEQLKAVIEDIKPDSIKTGMISQPQQAYEVAKVIVEYKLKNIVIDPVICSKHNNILTPKNSVKSIIENLFPVSDIVTPNIPEAEFITGIKIKNLDHMIKAAEKIYRLGIKNVLLKGGHLKEKKLVDLFYSQNQIEIFENVRIETKNTHGTGCALSAAIAANLSKGLKLIDAVDLSINYIHLAIKKSFNIGKGCGPINHFV
ncbi:MAG: bifunctional hydroxymethylpyrimidine kinase/phosphomethylpyrimidine kinase [Elusimicrobiota bacterium]